MTEPLWLTKARSYIGFQEQAGNRGIQEFIALAHTGEEGDPWCAIFANACLESVGVKGTRSPAANSFTQSPLFVRQQTPQIGTICTFTRPGGNHVAFYTGIDTQGRLLVLGGNQGDKVGIEPHTTDTLTGYWWPAETAIATVPVVPTVPSKPVLPLDDATIAKIVGFAAASDLARHSWAGRGPAPIGYVEGVAVTYGQVLRRLAAGDSVARAMVQIVDGPHDVFDHYEPILIAAGMITRNAPDIDRLRILFVILVGLGIRESSGGDDIGRDTSASNTSADTAEAGTWQQSRDSFAASGDPELPKVFATYVGSAPDAVDAIFKRGTSPHPSAFENFGDPNSDGFKFQALCKARPSIASLFAAIGMRTDYPHWGPLINHAAEIVPAADALFRQVQTIVGPIDGEVLPPLKINDDLLNLVFFLSQEGDTMDAKLQAQIIAEINKANPADKALLLQALGSTGTLALPAPTVDVQPVQTGIIPGFDLSKFGPLGQNPEVQQAIQKAVGEVLHIIVPAVLSTLSGQPVQAFPSPATVPPGQPGAVPGAPATPAAAPMSNTAFNWSTMIGASIAALTATAAGIQGSPIPGDPAFSMTGLLTFAGPLMAAATGIPAPVFAAIGSGLSALLPKLIKPKA